MGALWRCAVAELAGEEWRRVGGGWCELAIAEDRRSGLRTAVAREAAYPHREVLRLALSLNTVVRHTADAVCEIRDGDTRRTLGLHFEGRNAATSCVSALEQCRRPDENVGQEGSDRLYRVSLRRGPLPQGAPDGRRQIGYGVALAVDGVRIVVSRVMPLGPADLAGVRGGHEVVAVAGAAIEGTGEEGVRRAAKVLAERLKLAQEGGEGTEWCLRRPRGAIGAQLGKPLHGPLRAAATIRQTRALTRVLDALGVYRDIDAAAAALEPSGEEFYATSWQPGYPDEDPVSIKTSRVSGQLEVEFEAPTVSAMRRLLLKMHDALLGLLDKVVPEATMQDKQVVSWDRRTKGKVVGYDRATGLCAVRSVESGEEATLHASLLEVDTSLLASGTAPTDDMVKAALRELREERLTQRRNPRLHPSRSAALLRGRRGWRVGEERVALLDEVIDLDGGAADEGTATAIAGPSLRQAASAQLDALRELGAELQRNRGALSSRVEVQLKSDGVAEPTLFVDAVAACSVLSHVSLSACGLRDGGAVRLACAIAANRAVLGLDLGCNELTWRCCDELARCLQSSSLQSLDLSTNSARAPTQARPCSAD